MIGVNAWWVYLAPQNIPHAIVLTLGNKVTLYIVLYFSLQRVHAIVLTLGNKVILYIVLYFSLQRVHAQWGHTEAPRRDEGAGFHGHWTGNDQLSATRPHQITQVRRMSPANMPDLNRIWSRSAWKHWLKLVFMGDSCTPACFQTGSIWPKLDAVSRNQIGSRLALHNMIRAVCGRTQLSLKVGNW